MTIAVEIHFSNAHSEEDDEFAGFFTFIVASSIRNFGASYASDHPSDISGEVMANAFDNDFRTKWTTTSLPAYNTLSSIMIVVISSMLIPLPHLVV